MGSVSLWGPGVPGHRATQDARQLFMTSQQSQLWNQTLSSPWSEYTDSLGQQPVYRRFMMFIGPVCTHVPHMSLWADTWAGEAWALQPQPGQAQESCCSCPAPRPARRTLPGGPEVAAPGSTGRPLPGLSACRRLVSPSGHLRLFVLRLGLQGSTSGLWGEAREPAFSSQSSKQRGLSCALLWEGASEERQVWRDPGCARKWVPEKPGIGAIRSGGQACLGPSEDGPAQSLDVSRGRKVAGGGVWPGPGRPTPTLEAASIQDSCRHRIHLKPLISGLASPTEHIRPLASSGPQHLEPRDEGPPHTTCSGTASRRFPGDELELLQASGLAQLLSWR